MFVLIKLRPKHVYLKYSSAIKMMDMEKYVRNLYEK